MQIHPHVLIYGNDAGLLRTRGWLLAKAGFLVEQASSLAEMEKKAVGHRPDLLVLCHTLSGKECAEVEQIATQSQPCIKTLALLTRLSGCMSETATTLLTVPADPLRLITTVQRLAREANGRADAGHAR